MTEREQIDAIIADAAERWHLPFWLVDAVVCQESRYNPKAKSPCGACGLMQLMPKTAKWMGLKDGEDIFDPARNVDLGCKYLVWLMKRYQGDLRLVLAGYNAGPGNVTKYGGIPPFVETLQYVDNIMAKEPQNA
jgi:soluble lytic murein transglycosylase-like protein